VLRVSLEDKVSFLNFASLSKVLHIFFNQASKTIVIFVFWVAPSKSWFRHKTL